ncbi:tax1-binding protein 1 homolog [Anneissia japonica]|uniref:tax1-binding protein 1 homolog n=1 Tax=Anneissia japonica TaxID=1529436 RepID=UPI0014259006|nr:tax1-binding protein 1 homolog [Anneissia japonica]XP_033114731.1 tax1-binding protein 1 homolog [Anneissia japonica]
MDSQESNQTMDFAQVIFHNVSENYPPEAHIQCSYTLTKSIEPNKNDWVGLFKIGWSSTREKITYDWAPVPADWKDGQEYKLSILFNSYYLPKDDGEFYQFCYIDKAGKMKGASTPFQFLHLTDVDFVEIDDEYDDMLMIQSKTIIQEEKLKRAMDEKEKILLDQQELVKAKDDLIKKLAETSEALAMSDASVEDLKRTKEELLLKLTGLETQTKLLETKLCEASDRIKKLEEENARHKTMLESTEADLKEVVASNNNLSSVKAQLATELMGVTQEKDQYKNQFSLSEQEVKALELKVDDLTQKLLFHSNKTSELELMQVEEKKKVEQQLLVARADRDYWKSNEERLKQVESQLAATKQTKTMLTEEISTLKTVQHKLSKDLENASIEKDHLNDRLLKSCEDFRKKEATLQQKVIRQEHAFREKEALLQEQLKVMRQGMNKLAKDHEKLQKNVKDTVAGGPSEALKVALDDLRAKLKKRQVMYDQLYKEKVELEKKLITIEQEKTDLCQEKNDYKTRLAMAAEEYKAKYLECHLLQRKLNKAEKKQQKDDITEEAVKKEATTMLQQACGGAMDKGTQSGIPAVALKGMQDQKQQDRDKTFDMNEIKQQLQTMEEELTKREQKIKKYKKLYQEEKIKNEEQCAIFSDQMKDLHNRLVEETQVKEGMKEDFENIYQQKEMTIRQLEAELEVSKISCNASSTVQVRPQEEVKTVRRPVPPQPSIYVNPYAKDAQPVYKNPYEPDTTHVVVFQPKSEVNNLDVDGSEELSLLPPKNPPTMNLPEPLEPLITPEAKIAAMKNVIKATTNMIDELDPVPVEKPDQDTPPPTNSGQDDDKEDVAAEFHDAHEFPVEAQISKCPECQLVFPPSFSEQKFFEHLSTHAFKRCPMCDFACSPDTSQEVFEEHVQGHFRN